MSITVDRRKFNYFGEIIFFLLIGSVIGGCASDTSWDRHNLSRLYHSDDGQTIYFDATTTSQYPPDSDAADAIREEWIGQWLKLRNLCAQGHKVVDRRNIRSDEDNPHRHDQRYTIACN